MFGKSPTAKIKSIGNQGTSDLSLDYYRIRKRLHATFSFVEKARLKSLFKILAVIDSPQMIVCVHYPW